MDSRGAGFKWINRSGWNQKIVFWKKSENQVERWASESQLKGVEKNTMQQAWWEGLCTGEISQNHQKATDLCRFVPVWAVNVTAPLSGTSQTFSLLCTQQPHRLRRFGKHVHPHPKLFLSYLVSTARTTWSAFQLPESFWRNLVKGWRRSWGDSHYILERIWLHWMELFFHFGLWFANFK